MLGEPSFNRQAQPCRRGLRATGRVSTRQLDFLTVFTTPAVRKSRQNGTVIVRDGRIATVNAQSAVTIPRGVRVIDVHGKTIIPELWDMHAHVALRK